jgi:Uma2 family endonuclease
LYQKVNYNRRDKPYWGRKMTAFPHLDNPNLTFPDSDGKPMADNTEQYRWIVIIKENLEILFADDPDVFVAGDLLWYPVRARLIAPTAPDVMVAMGRPKGKRGSYRQWVENNIPPQVVFEIRSPGNSDEELERKLEFYENYGVEEYYLYDPDRLTLQGWWRQQQLTPIEPPENWVSPRLGIRLTMGQGGLEIYRPDGERFLTSVELFQRAEQERQRAEQEHQRAEQEHQRAEQERQRAERLAEYLRTLGIDPDHLP